MAKKKRKSPVVTASRPAAGPAPPIKAAPAEPGGPNRLARKEEARRQREALRRKMARRKYYRVVTIVTALALVAAVITWFLVNQNSQKRKKETISKQAAACGPVITTHAYSGDNDRTHIGPGGKITTPPALSTYPTQPPASGPHDPTPLDAGVYSSPPAIYNAIHSLEHGAVIVWYRPGLVSSELTAVKDLYRDPTGEGDHVIVGPYQYPGTGGSLPAGKQMVLIAWHKYQSCGKVNLSVVKSFVAAYRTKTGASKPANAPEAGAKI